MKANLGPEIAQSNRQIRNMFRLAKPSRKDVFYDLGCGRAQLCIIAVTEFGMKRAVGIESHKGRARKAKIHVKNLGLSGRIEIRRENFYVSDLKEATIVYNGLTENETDLEFYEERLKRGSKLITLSLPLIGIMANLQDYPFYLMRTPFTKTRDVSAWITGVLSRRGTLRRLFSELDLDPDFKEDRRTLKLLMAKRFG